MKSKNFQGGRPEKVYYLNEEQATVMQLNNLSLMEHIILHVIDTGILTGKHYKEIYQACKHRLGTIRDLAYLEAGA